MAVDVLPSQQPVRAQSQPFAQFNVVRRKEQYVSEIAERVVRERNRLHIIAELLSEAAALEEKILSDGRSLEKAGRSLLLLKLERARLRQAFKASLFLL